ncbi:MAG: protein kinase [Planctomycetota bacterium]
MGVSDRPSDERDASAEVIRSSDAAAEDELGTAAISVPDRGRVRRADSGAGSADALGVGETVAGGDETRGEESQRRRGVMDMIMAARMQATHRSGPMVPGTPGGTIPGYQVQRELHRGGQGVVYLATHEGTRRQVAIKVMLNGGFASPHDKVRFEREIQVLAQLNNPNIVTIHDSGQAGEHSFYVMDFVSGPTLDDFVAGADLSIRQKLELFVVVCHAVNAAHLRGVIHRDLKPSNIRVTPEGSPQVLDFGLAKVEGDDDLGATMPTEVTREGQFVGSLPWSSPEQARGESDRLDVRTDVYALGVILYQMLCGGEFPYEVDGPMRDVLDNIMTKAPARPRSVDRRIDAEIEAIVLKSLEKARERRYQSAGEFARDVERYLSGETIEARRWNKRYVVFKFLERNRGVTFGVLGAFAVLLVGSVWTATLLTEQRLRDRDEAERASSLEAQLDKQREVSEDLVDQNELLTEQLSQASGNLNSLRSRVDELARENAELRQTIEVVGDGG